MQHAGKRVLVNGSSRGIGRAIAEALAAEGAHVVLTYHAHGDEADEAVRGIIARGGVAHAVKADTSSETEVAALVEAAADVLGGIDIFVNNAGLMCLPGFLDLEASDWRRTLDVNLTGCFLACQAVARLMVAQATRGVIVTISSGGAFGASTGMTAYKVSKAGVEMLTRLMALELAPHGIRVNSIAPGLIATDINRERLSDPVYRDQRLSTIPLRMIGDPADFAAGVLYLVSDAARLVSGMSLRVDGGRAALNR
jgi:NAD(P)-dependent dehydrogenase (short-subunit alcohol dehydrogenase family)